MAIFKMLILPIHEHGRSFHLLQSSSIPFFIGLQFSFKRSLASFLKFILRYFVVFEAIVNGIVYLISLSVCSLLVYRRGTDTAELLKEFMISSSFLGLLGIGSCPLQIGLV
jgi:hypothetical protein